MLMVILTKIREDGDLDGLEGVRGAATRVEGAPARDDGGAGAEYLILLGEGHGLDDT